MHMSISFLFILFLIIHTYNNYRIHTESAAFIHSFAHPPSIAYRIGLCFIFSWKSSAQ